MKILFEFLSIDVLISFFPPILEYTVHAGIVQYCYGTMCVMDFAVTGGSLQHCGLHKNQLDLEAGAKTKTPSTATR